MGRLVDADALIQEISGNCDYKNGTRHIAFNEGLEMACNIVDAQPTIQHERTAKIIMRNREVGETLPECGNCDVKMLYKSNYCPNCGAKFVDESQDSQDLDTKCTACAGTGFYDSLDEEGNQIECAACSGTGKQEE